MITAALAVLFQLADPAPLLPPPPCPPEAQPSTHIQLPQVAEVREALERIRRITTILEQRMPTATDLANIAAKPRN